MHAGEYIKIENLNLKTLYIIKEDDKLKGCQKDLVYFSKPALGLIYEPIIEYFNEKEKISIDGIIHNGYVYDYIRFEKEFEENYVPVVLSRSAFFGEFKTVELYRIFGINAVARLYANLTASYEDFHYFIVMLPKEFCKPIREEDLKSELKLENQHYSLERFKLDEKHGIISFKKIGVFEFVSPKEFYTVLKDFKKYIMLYYPLDEEIKNDIINGLKNKTLSTLIEAQ